MDLTLISILMPVRNTALFLEECLDSILAQSYLNWELIAIEDHSEDNSWSILQSYAAKDPRIKTFQNSGKGIIQALRMAYQYSSGNYITRMDSDDIMPSQKLEILQANLSQAKEGHLATGLVQYFSAKALGNGYLRYAEWLNSLSKEGTNFKEIYKECVIPSPCWMVHRVDLEASGAFRPDRYPEDYDLCFRFYEQGLICLPSDDILHCWRDSEGRTSRHDPNYADNTFLDIKFHYFIKLDYQKERPLVLWGAGKKGKKLAMFLKEINIPFHWICNNEQKIGKDIYEQRLHPETHLDNLTKPQIIIAIAQPEAKNKINNYFNNKKLESIKDYFFFC
jgi:glycosyltransferase involved in cell wall biosynthesis